MRPHSRKARGPGILVLGDINVDMLARLEAAPVLGGDCLAKRVELSCGGVGANTALALAKWGVRVRLVGSTGRDWFGDYVLRTLQQGGVDVSSVEQTERALTGLIFVAVSPDGQRTMFGSRGANAELRAPGVRPAELEGLQAVHLVGYNFLSPSVAEVAGRFLEEARRRNKLISLDVGMAASHQIPQTILHVAGKVDILLASADEATALTGQRDSRKAFDSLEQCGAGEVVVKLGERGCLFREEAQCRKAPAFPVRTLDTTGAGDAFTAAFLRARLQGWPRAESALLANAAGAAAASVLGAGEKVPDPETILRLLSAGRLPAEWEPVRTHALERLKGELRLVATADS